MNPPLSVLICSFGGNLNFLCGKNSPARHLSFRRSAAGGRIARLACAVAFFVLPAAVNAAGEGGAPVSVWDDIAAQAEKDPPDKFSHARAALESRERMKGYYATFAEWKAPESPPVAEGKRLALTEKPVQPRFELTDKVWPEKPGEASVCLWEDDKVAAASFGIDDNNAMDVPAWEEISQKYGGLPLTWFLITNNIGGGVDAGRISSAGTWDTWQRMRAAGHELGSHSVTHAANPVYEDGWPGPDWEAAESKRTIDTNLEGQFTRVYAGPGAPIKGFAVAGQWRPSVEKYYQAARGWSGVPISRANQIDYFDIRSTAALESLVDGEAGKDGYYVGNVLDPQSQYYRGWVTGFIHFIGGVSDLAGSGKPGLVACGKLFDFFNTHRDDLWLATFGDVARYGQERDTATLTTTRANDREIVLALTSEMDPALFDYPLTLKVRLPDSWKAAQATQGGKEAPVTVVQHDNAPYALVKAVPGKGEILLTPAS